MADLTYMKPPVTSAITMLSLTSSASALTSVASTFVPGNYIFECEDDVFLLFSNDGANVADPDITATSGTDVPGFFEKGKHLLTLGPSNQKFKGITSGATVKIRWYFEQRV